MSLWLSRQPLGWFWRVGATPEGRWFLIGSSCAFGTASLANGELYWAALSYGLAMNGVRKWRARA